MRGASNLFQLSQIASTSHLLKHSIFPRGIANAAKQERNKGAEYFDKLMKEKPPATTKNLDAFQKLPVVMPAIDILQSALAKARRVLPSEDIANPVKQERNKGAKHLHALRKEIAVSLQTYSDQFPNKRYLHPYERSLIELTLGGGNYEQFLTNLDALRKEVVSVGKKQAFRCAKALTKGEAEERLREGIKKIEEVFHRKGNAVDELLNVAESLRAMHVVDLGKPTLCLVGAPNVGKSSLVRIISTGKPEICNYPFTTRGILMGHITVNYQNCQVTDTPGLLRRHDADRNNFEKLTLSVLSHLPTAVLYVHDLTGECGTSPSDQYLIYKEVRERFSDHLWLDVISKCDLLQQTPELFVTEDANADNLDLANYLKTGPEGALHVSTISEVGLHELKKRVHELLLFQSERIKAQQSSQEIVEAFG